MNHDEQFIKDYFQQFIQGFIFNDIDKSINAGTNFMIALALMSYTEHLGSLMTGKLGISGFSESNFNKALEYFDFNGDINYYKDFKVKDNKSGKELNIYKIFRCGLVHEYFPKGLEKMTIHNEPSYLPSTDVGISWVDFGTERRLRFHCNAYFRDFKNAFNKYKEDLLVKKDSILLENFDNAINNIESYDIEEIV